MTPQEIFDTVLDHLAKQKCRAIDSFGNCQYRTKDGYKCAVGALIPDELYDSRMDICEAGPGGLIYGGAVTFVIDGIRAGIYSPKLSFLGDHETLLGELQSVHDSSDSWEYRTDMGDGLFSIAIKHELNAEKVVPTLDAIFGAET